MRAAPEAARNFIKRAASVAKERVAGAHAGAETAAAAMEGALIKLVGVIATVVRSAESGLHQDAEAFLAGVDQLASANFSGGGLQDSVRSSARPRRSRHDLRQVGCRIFQSVGLRRREFSAGEFRQGRLKRGADVRLEGPLRGPSFIRG